MNPVLGFNLAANGSGSNLAGPRIMKGRKQTSSYNHKPSYPMDSRGGGEDRGLGFSKFGSSSRSVFGDLSCGSVVKETLVFGANGGNGSGSGIVNNASAILDDMSRLKIDATGNKKSVDTKLMVDELPKEISKMKIEGTIGIETDKKSQFTDFVDSNVALELENEMKRMDLKDPTTDIYSGKGNFGSLKIGNECNEEGANAKLMSDRMREASRSSSTRSEKMAEFAFTSKLDDIGASHVEFKTPDMKSNVFSGLNRFEAKKESVKNTKSKKNKGKPKNPVVGQSRFREDFGFSGRSWSENVDTSEAYSPMDISPCHETPADDCYRETSLTSEEMKTCLTAYSAWILVMVIETLFSKRWISETESFKSATENMEFSSDTFVTALDSDESSTATSGRQESPAMRVFNFASKSDNKIKDGFTFAASSSSQRQFPSDSHRVDEERDASRILSDINLALAPSSLHSLPIFKLPKLPFPE
ncbi:hypothetical protein OSB04_009553 [Centaurea solstitialis]|uniref:Uncharacterized protein n=1 Tax=Centaurea solstitialis TaxID=347529 RepID=A0AA38T5V3_9ASTR|nr:hypothetical protein OSB04_009553 [Centaurea solstitialis]